MGIIRVPSFKRRKQILPENNFWISFLQCLNNCLSNNTKEENIIKMYIENNNKKLEKKITDSNNIINAHLIHKNSLFKQKKIINSEKNTYEKYFNQYQKIDNLLTSKIEEIDKKVSIIKDDQNKNKKINLKHNEEFKIDLNSKAKKLELKKKFG